MEELINQIKLYLGNSAENVFKKGPAEIEVVVDKDGQQLSENLKAHILDLVNEDTIAEISFVDPSGNLIDSFSLNQ
jgi:hypothetical protein